MVTCTLKALLNSSRGLHQMKSNSKRTIRASLNACSTTSTYSITKTTYHMVKYKSFLCPRPPPPHPNTEADCSDTSTVRLDLDEYSSSNASGNLIEPAKAGLKLKDRVTQNSANETFSQLMTNAQVYAMAEKFYIPDLKLLAQEKFLEHAHGWPIPGLAAVTREVLTSTPQSDRGLRTIVRDIVSLHVAEITSVPQNEDPEQYSDRTPESLQWVSVLRQEGGFLFEVLGEVTTHNAKQIKNQDKLAAVPAENLQHHQDELKRLELEIKALRLSQDEARRSESEDKVTHVDQDEIKRLERENQALRSAKIHAIRTIRAEKDNEIKAIRFEKNNELKAIRFEKKNCLKRGGRLVAAINDYDYCRHCSEAFQPRVVGIVTLDDWVDKGVLKCKRCHATQDWA